MDINNDNLERRLKFLESMVEIKPENKRMMTKLLVYLKSVVLRKYPRVKVKSSGSCACDLAYIAVI